VVAAADHAVRVLVAHAAVGLVHHAHARIAVRRLDAVEVVVGAVGRAGRRAAIARLAAILAGEELARGERARGALRADAVGPRDGLVRSVGQRRAAPREAVGRRIVVDPVAVVVDAVAGLGCAGVDRLVVVVAVGAHAADALPVPIGVLVDAAGAAD